MELTGIEYPAAHPGYDEQSIGGQFEETSEDSATFSMSHVLSCQSSLHHHLLSLSMRYHYHL